MAFSRIACENYKAPEGLLVLGGFLGREQMQADLKTESDLADLAVQLEECFERREACHEKVFALEKPYDEAEQAMNKAENALNKARERFEKVQERYREADERAEEADTVLKRVREKAAAAGLIQRFMMDDDIYQYGVTEEGKAYLPEDKSYGLGRKDAGT
jgi:chromosome segregation ATPase